MKDRRNVGPRKNPLDKTSQFRECSVDMSLTTECSKGQRNLLTVTIGKGGTIMFLSPQLSLRECQILEYVLTRFLEIEENEGRKAQIQRLHTKFRDTVITEENMIWDAEKLQEESPEL